MTSSDQEDEDNIPDSPELEEEEPEDDYEHEQDRRRSKPHTKSRSGTVTRETALKEAPTPGSRYGGVRIPGMPPTGSNYSDESGSPTHEAPKRRSNGPKQPPLSPGLRRSMTAPPKPTKVLKAKWAYSATERDELELGVGDRVRVTSEVNSEWFIGTNESTGASGMFPAAYCVADDSTSTPKFVIDTFADPEDDEEDIHGDATEEDESESAALRPSRTSTGHQSYQSPPSMKKTPSYSKLNASSTATVSGKRAPPPPPTRRATTASAKPHYPHAQSLSSSTGSAGDSNDQPEAFGSVSELKKRLGMFK